MPDHHPPVLSTALLGAGAMGSNHARTIDSHPGSTLSVVVDVDERRARDMAARYGAMWTSDPDNVSGVDAAVVATPAHLHTDLVLGLLTDGVAVLVEKPVALEPLEVATVVDVAAHAGVHLGVGFVERFNPVVLAVHEHLAVFGPAVHVQMIRHSPPNTAMPTSVVHDLLIHDLDLVDRLGDHLGIVTNPPLLLPMEAARYEAVDVTGRSGRVGFNLSASRIDQRKVRDLRVVTDTAVLEADLLRRTMTVYRHVMHGVSVDNGYQAQTVIDIPFVRQEGEPLMLQWRHFVDAVLEPTPARSDLVGLVDVHAAADAIEAGAAHTAASTALCESDPAESRL